MLRTHKPIPLERSKKKEGAGDLEEVRKGVREREGGG